jgi:hypothetical protein
MFIAGLIKTGSANGKQLLKIININYSSAKEGQVQGLGKNLLSYYVDGSIHNNNRFSFTF